MTQLLNPAVSSSIASDVLRSCLMTQLLNPIHLYSKLVTFTGERLPGPMSRSYGSLYAQSALHGDTQTAARLTWWQTKPARAAASTVAVITLGGSRRCPSDGLQLKSSYIHVTRYPRAVAIGTRPHARALVSHTLTDPHLPHVTTRAFQRGRVGVTINGRGIIIEVPQSQR